MNDEELLTGFVDRRNEALAAHFDVRADFSRLSEILFVVRMVI